MIRQLHLLITLLLFCQSSQVSAETVTFDANAEGAAATETKDGITIKMPYCATTLGNYSIYTDRYGTVSAESGKVITKIVLYAYRGSEYITGLRYLKPTPAGTYTVGDDRVTWVGKTDKVKFKALYMSAYISKIDVTYGSESLQDARLSFSETSYTVQSNDEFAAPTVNNPNNLTVTYASLDPKIATVDASTGKVTLVAAGKTTITAESEATTKYLAGSASYDLTVSAASGAKKPAGLSFSEQNVTANAMQDVTEPTLSNPYSLDITYSSSNTKVATVDASGNVTAVAVGTADITASFAGNDQYEAGAASYTIYVYSSTGLKFRKVTSDASLTSGKRYMIVAQDGDGKLHAANSKVSNYVLSGTEVTAKNDIISVDNTDYVFRLQAQGQGSSLYYIVLNKGNYLLAKHGTQDLQSNKDNSTGYAVWKISINSDNKAIIRNNNESQRCLVYNTSKDLFAAYQPGKSYIYPYLYEEVTSSSNDVTVSVSEVGYATLYYSDRALKVPQDVTAMVYSYDKGDKKLSVSKRYNAGVTIPKGTAVVLAAESGKYTFAVSDEDGEAPSASNLYGYDEQKTTAVDGMTKYYKLSLDADKTEGSVGFYWGATDGGAFESQAHKAFLALPDEASANCFVFADITDGISSVTSGRYTDKGAIYSLTGVRMSGHLPAGIYIRDGKKFVVK